MSYRFELFAVQATHPSQLTAKAHVVLPACVWQEVDGTITNRKGEVQRLRATVQPPGAVRAHGQILMQLGRRLGLTFEYASVRAIFDAMSRELDFFSDASWSREVAPTLLRYAGSRG